MIPKAFKGRARRIDDLDLPRAGRMIGVGEDEIHAILEVESRGSGFDSQGRPLILFEPHLFWRELGPGSRRDAAAKAGLAYPKWGAVAYPKDSYPRLVAAMKIDEKAALRSASWGLGQILGSNHKAAGYDTVQAFVAAMCDDEEHHLNAMVRFIVSAGLAPKIRAHDWAGFARGYNGPGYAKHNYHGRLAAAYARWSKIKDTPFRPGDAAGETNLNDPAPHVVVMPRGPAPVEPPAKPAPPAAPAPAPDPVPQPAPAPRGVWSRVKTWLGGGA